MGELSGYEIQLKAVSKTYEATAAAAEVRALDAIDLTFDAGSTTALVGPSGSGKSTLLHILGAMDRADSGSVLVDGLDLTKVNRSTLVAYRRTVGFVFQSFALLPALTARDNVALPTIPYKVPTQDADRATRLLAEVGLHGRETALPSQLSGGQRQRVAIARALINHPRLLLADEPTGNLDSATGDAILDLIFTLHQQTGVTIVLATHDPTVAQRCDHAIEVLDGKLHNTAREPSKAGGREGRHLPAPGT